MSDDCISGINDPSEVHHLVLLNHKVKVPEKHAQLFITRMDTKIRQGLIEI